MGEREGERERQKERQRQRQLERHVLRTRSVLSVAPFGTEPLLLNAESKTVRCYGHYSR